MLSDAALKSELKYFSGGLLLCTFVSQDPKALMGPLQGGEKKKQQLPAQRHTLSEQCYCERQTCEQKMEITETGIGYHRSRIRMENRIWGKRLKA